MRFSRRTAILAAAALLGGCAHAPFPSREDAVSSLAQADLTMAELATRTSVRDAFLRALSERSVLFTPEPVNGREEWGRRAPTDHALRWYPAHAYAAASADLGFTTGPYELTPAGATAAEHGWYVNVWGLEGGAWRLLTAAGAPAPTPPSPAPPRWRPPATFRTPISPMGAPLSRVRETLLAADRSFGQWAGDQGLGVALDRFGADGVRLLRAGSHPAVGRAAAAAHPAASAKQPAVTVDAFVSRAGDFGWTYGTYRVAGTPETGHYLRIWSRTFRGDWKVLLDATTPRPGEREE